MGVDTQGIALLDAGGRVIGAVDSVCNLFTNEFRQLRTYRPRARPAPRVAVDHDVEIDATVDIDFAATIRGYHRLR